MTRIFTDGAETGYYDFWTMQNGNVFQAGRSGSYCYSVSNNGNYYLQKSISPLAEFYLRFAHLEAGTQAFLYLRSGTTTLLTISFNAARNITASIGGTSTVTIPSSTWYLFELYYKLDNSAGRVHIKVDGQNSGINFTGDTQPGADTTINNLYFPAFSGLYNYIDDLALNDTAGAADNSWCGDGRVVALAPNGDVGSPQWMGSDGNQVDNYALVDEIPQNDADYVRSQTSGNEDLYNLGTFTIDGAVRRLQILGRAKGASVPASLDTGFRINSVDYLDTISLNSTFSRIEGPEYKLNPNTSQAWTQSDIDGLQVKIKAP